MFYEIGGEKLLKRKPCNPLLTNHDSSWRIIHDHGFFMHTDAQTWNIMEINSIICKDACQRPLKSMYCNLVTLVKIW